METTDDMPADPSVGAVTPGAPSGTSDVRPVSPGEIQAYHRIKRSCHIAGIVLGVTYWAAWWGLSFLLVEALAERIESRWLLLFAAAAVMCAGSVLWHLPLDFYSSYTVEKRFQLSNQTVRDWIVFQLKGWLVGGVLAVILLSGLYAALWYSGPLWGVYVWVGVMLLSVVLAKVFPLIILPLFYPSVPLDRPSLTRRLTEMAEGTGMKVKGVFNLGLSKETKKANAMLAGLGSSRRVYLSDTLLEAFTDDQIAVVFAHELGHHVRGHILKGIAMTALVTSVLVGVIYWLLNPYAGDEWGDSVIAVATFAQVMFATTVFPLVIGPLTNAISRHFEREADSLALELTDDPAAFKSSFELLSRMNLADPNPPRWEEILFDDHPAIGKRIARAEAYEQIRTAGGSVAARKPS